jgi:hypothetical protein
MRLNSLQGTGQLCTTKKLSASGVGSAEAETPGAALQLPESWAHS